jgi:BarA-like signal transduction histidine kinase
MLDISLAGFTVFTLVLRGPLFLRTILEWGPSTPSRTLTHVQLIASKPPVRYDFALVYVPVRVTDPSFLLNIIKNRSRRGSISVATHFVMKV